MTSLAIIPARGGSKRIPRKNIRTFCGKPILAYSILAAMESESFDEIMVSTDDEEIAEIARTFGASVPFLRSPDTSNDHAGILEVLEEVVKRYESEFGKSFDSICCILPTAPLIQAEDLGKAKAILEEKNFDAVFPVVRFSYPILRSLKVEGDHVSMIWPENYSKRSQDLAPAFHDVGQFYWIHPEPCFRKGRVFTDNAGSVEISELQVQDIDTEDDWKICELKYRFLNRKKVLLLTEAGPEIGMGHLTRCTSIAKKFEERDCQVKLWVHAEREIPLPGGLKPRNWWMGDASLLEEVRSAELVLLDSFRIPYALLDAIQNQAKHLAVIDDFPRRSYGKGVVVDWTVGAQQSWFPESNECKYLLGPRYCSLRPAFWDRVPRREFALRRLLVTFGGTDVRSLTGPCIRAIGKAFPELEIEVVAKRAMASGFEDLELPNLRYHSDLDDQDMAALMRRCDLAISGGGQTLYELASCGCPSVVVGLVDNQEDDIRGFETAGVIHFVGEWNIPDLWSRVTEAVKAFQDPNMLMEHSRKGSALVDGRGSDRLVDELLDQLKRPT